MRFPAALLLLSPLGALHAVPLDPLLAQPRLWSTTQTDFTQFESARPFRWTSQAHDSARAGETELTLLNLPVIEAVARFDEGRLNEITATIYARGDAGELSKEQFESLVRRCVAAVGEAAKVKFTIRGKDPKGAVHAEGLIWQTPALRYLLEYSASHDYTGGKPGFRAEFVRLQITSPEKVVSLLESAADPVRARFVGAAHIKRDLNSGDVSLRDVPMVDQGQKGYCAVACTERVMRYYGVRVDENEIAQVANSNEEGTSPTAMFAAVTRLGARLRVRVRGLEQMEVRQLLLLITEYNRMALKEHAEPLPSPGRMLDVAAIYGAMKPDVLKETRLKNKSDLNRFQREIQSRIEQGTPLLWSVILGLVPEQGLSQAAGGHMRLIIGYNARTQEVLYSDSWGAGHELKRMAAGDAWTITTGLSTIEPL